MVMPENMLNLSVEEYLDFELHSDGRHTRLNNTRSFTRVIEKFCSIKEWKPAGGQ